MAGVTLDDLKARLEDATAGLADVSVRRAFGSFGLFVGDTIFALAWKRELRLGVKLPDQASHASLLGIEGSAAWAPHKSPMRGWVLVPEAWHDDLAALRPWVRRAYEQVQRERDDDVPSMRERAREDAKTPAKLRARVAKSEEPEAAIETLHAGATRARRLEKPGTRTAAAPVKATKKVAKAPGVKKAKKK